MNNPEFEPDVLKSIDTSGYSEKQTDLAIDKKGTVRQQIKQVNAQPQKSGVMFDKKQKKSNLV